MKRSPELRDLSEQHHHGLVEARRLRRAGAGEAPLEEAVALFLDAWQAEVQPHFRAEEAVLLPEFARVVPPDDPLILRTLTEHVVLRRCVRELERAAAGDGDAAQALHMLAAEVGLLLHDHIRFEERVLFPAIEAALDASALLELKRLLDDLSRSDPPRMPGCRLTASGRG